MSMTIQSGVKDKILATPSETSKVENAPAKMLRDLNQQMEKRANDGCTLWIKLYSKYKYEIRYHLGRENVVIDALRRKERVKPRHVRAMAMTIQFQDVKLARIHIDEIIARNGILVTLKLRFRWVNYLVVLADAAESVSDAIRFEYCLASSSGWTKRKPLEFEVRDRVLLKVTPWKGVVRFGKKGKLAPRYVGPFEILERIGPVAYRLRLPEELKPVENSDREVKRLKCSRMVVVKAKLLAVRYLVKVSWNSKGNFELTWVWEDYLKDKYPRLIVWLVKPLVLTYESVVMYGLCVYMRYVDCVRVGNQSIERDRLIGIGLVMDLVKFLSFTFGGKEMTFVVLAFLR
ncbi:hypothetical protein Tco_0373662 [Tanacetum coccineum]